ncbi:MAG: hypothetical protein ACREIT_08165, partial [Tepidisphaeraceae bacterium]
MGRALVGAWCIAWLFAATGLVNWCRADTPVAPLNGSASFSSPSSSSDTLKVNAGSQTIKASSANKVQGDPNSHVSVISSQGSGIVSVASVTGRAGESLYTVSGDYLDGGGGGGGGGPPPTWDASYSGGGNARLLLEVNGSGSTDNQVYHGPNGGTLTVSLADGGSGQSYSASLSDSGTGNVGFSSSSVSLTGPADSKTVTLSGEALGAVAINAEAQDAEEASVNAEVIPPTVVKLQWQTDGEFADVTGTITITKGTSITFKAIPSPSTATWPSGNPTWSGSSGASGSGETKSITFNTLSTNSSDYKTVTASCGTSSKTANVIVGEWQYIADEKDPDPVDGPVYVSTPPWPNDENLNDSMGND